MLDVGGASDSEDDLATKTTFTSGASTAAKLKAMAANGRRASTTATKRKAPAKSNNRQALKDRTNVQDRSDAEDSEDDGSKPKSKRAKTTTTAQKRAAPAKSKTSATNRRAPATEALAVIPETQPNPDEDISQSIENVDAGAEMDVTNIPTPPRAQTYMQRARSTSVQPALAPLPVRASARSVSAQPGYPPPRERSGSAASERVGSRAGDAELRRQLTAVTKKHEDLKMKYQSLQELGQNGAASNFEKLRTTSERKGREAEEVIAALKKEVAELKKAGGNGGDTSTSNFSERLSAENKTLQSSLQTAENEKKALEAKLMAARQQIANSTTSANANKGTEIPANASDAMKELKMKENLYSDLTGLIIRGVKRKEGEDEYDCIQTGRNGSECLLFSSLIVVNHANTVIALHFHLSIANNSALANPKTPSGLSYEEAEFAYEPLLDEGRDRQLLDLLPDYLCEEICFPRNQAVKFYGKILESLSRRVVVEE